jgi:glycerol kinase
MTTVASPLIGAIDAGTSGVRFALFDSNARPLDVAYRAVPISSARSGWIEQDPDRLVKETFAVLREVLTRRRSLGGALAAIGLTNQRETVVAWDRESGRALHPAIVWQDRRTSERCRELRESRALRAIEERTGLRPDPYFSATKIEWLLRNVPKLRERAEEGRALFGTVDAWLLWHLTGNHATDDTNASRTMLFDIDRRQWDEELLSTFGVPRVSLPEVRPSLSLFGTVKSNIAPCCGVPIAGILGDQQAALLGQGIVSRGKAQVTWGTGAFLLADTGKERAYSRSRLVGTIARTLSDGSIAYALEGSVFVAGAAIQWLRDSMGMLANAADSRAIAESISSTEGVVFVPALTGLGAPHWDAAARGLIIGITRSTRPEHFVRAALESIAYQTHDVVRAMERDIGEAITELRVGGGASSNDFLCQFQSDILGIPVVRPKNLETTALGAAYAAGVAVGVWDGLDAAIHLWEEDSRFFPQMSERTRSRLLGCWRHAVQRSKAWSAGTG